MNHRKVIIGLVAAALIGSAGVAAQDQVDDAGESAFSALGPLTGGDAQEEVVEGHTVYTEIVNQQGSEQAAVVVNVENRSQGQVLWFDDTFLHQEEQAAACGGSVWATHSQGVLLSDKSLYEADVTYSIDTPQDNWLVTEFEGPDESVLTRAWAAEVKCPVEGEPYVADGFDGTGFPTYDAANSDPDATPEDVDPLPYNAILWFEFGSGHLGPYQSAFGQANFGENGADSETHDTTEGNSHPYNFDADQPAANHNHSTALISVYYLDQDNVDHGTVDFENNENFAEWHEHP